MDSFEIPASPISARKMTFAKGEQFFENFSASQTKMPWTHDLNLLLTPQAEDSLILPIKIEHDQIHRHISSPLEPLLTPLSSTISPQELLGGADIPGNGKFMFGGSPLFEDAEIDDSNQWESLFTDLPESNNDTAAASTLTIKAEPVSPKFELAEVIDDFKTLKRKRQTSVDSIGEYKKDALGITAYNRKPRSTPLSPIVVDECTGDVVTVKRARNTAAARRSRARKLERMTQLEAKVEELISQNSSLQSQNTQLKTDMAELRKSYGL